MTITTDELRRDKAALVQALRDAGADVRGDESIRCPFHDDRHASAGVWADGAGVWRFKCQASSCGASGDIFDIRARVSGRDVSDELRAHSGASSQSRGRGAAPAASGDGPRPRVFASVDELVGTFSGVEATYQFTHPDTGHLDLLVIRYRTGDNKRFVQAHQVDGGFVMGAPSKPWPLYNRGRSRATDDVVVVEGEKCVHALHELGIVATTSPAGAGKAACADWSPLAGKRVTLWPDNDPPTNGVRAGIKHMREVARILERLDPPASVRWIDPDSLSLPPKGDVVDLVEGLDPDDARELVHQVLADAVRLGPSEEVGGLIDDMAHGRYVAVPWPWRLVSKLSQALIPGTLTVVCGSPGASKSLMLLEAIAHWVREGVKVRAFLLEEPVRMHLLRALAQLGGCSSVTSTEWVRTHGEEARRLHRQHADELDRIGAALESVDEATTLDQLADRVERAAIAGARIIVVDPVTAAERSTEPYKADGKFVDRVKRAAEQCECSVVLVSHPRGALQGRPTLDDVAGGKAYVRFAQTVLWLEHLGTPREFHVMDLAPFGTTRKHVDANRILTIAKSRWAEGTGTQIAMEFDRQTLRLVEHGVIISEPKERRS